MQFNAQEILFWGAKRLDQKNTARIITQGALHVKSLKNTCYNNHNKNLVQSIIISLVFGITFPFRKRNSNSPIFFLFSKETVTMIQWTYLPNRNKFTDLENKLKSYQGGRSGEIVWEFGMDMYTLLLLFSPKLCPTLCHPIDWSTPGFPVPYYLPEFAQTHVNPYAATFKIKSLSTKKKNRKQLYCFVW